MGRTPRHPPRHRTRPDPLQALRRQRPLRPRLACPERATATEGTTKATSSASRACPESDSDEWVKCTLQRREKNTYRCVIDRNGIPYTPDQIDFFAIGACPERSRGINPRPSLLHNPASRHQQPTRHPPNPPPPKLQIRKIQRSLAFADAWHLLMCDRSEARVESVGTERPRTKKLIFFRYSAANCSSSMISTLRSPDSHFDTKD